MARHDRKRVELMRVMDPRLFPSILIALDLGASMVYYWHGDWRRGTYWLAAMTLTLMVVLDDVR